MDPLEASVIAGKYRLIRQLGQGGMGSVWLAQHLTLQSNVAIKLIHGEFATHGEAVSRFLREAQAAASLRSPHVVQIFDYGVDGTTPYMAMELLEGESLADRLARVVRLSPTELARIMTHIGRALSRAHDAGIVHRDLKPDNVFIVVNDDEEVAKILDFGIAKTTVAGSVGAAVGGGTRTGAVLGTPYYMSPEQAEGAKTLDHRTDIWAMGVMGFECMLGRRPFDAETLGGLLLAICSRAMPIPSQFGPVPPGFDEWFARACERDVTCRFSSARDAAAELKRVVEGAEYGQARSSADSIPSVGHRMQPPPQAAISGVRGQTAPGFASTDQGGQRPPRQKSSVGLILGLGLLGVGAVGAGLFGWSRLKSVAAPLTSSSVVVAADPPTVAALSARPTEPTPTVTPSATAANVAVAAPEVPSAAPPAAHAAAPAKKPGLAGAIKNNAKGAPAHTSPPAAAPPASPPVARPAAPAPINLGI